MMMKIFGAALIVSGGYLLGRIPSIQNKKRCALLQEITTLFQTFKHDLTEYRLSIRESFSKGGTMGEELLKGCDIQGLQKEDRTIINTALDQIKNASYRESIECVDSLLKKLMLLTDELLSKEKTTGKALPLVTGVIGLLIAILLF